MKLFRKYAFIFILLTNWQPLVVVNGLECNTCVREGDKGPRSLLPCGNAPCKIQDIQENSCIKIVGWGTRVGSKNQNSFSYVRASCQPVDHRYPPRTTPYHFVPGMESGLLSTGIKLENYSVYVCDENTKENCRVTWEDLNRSGATTLRGTASIIMITTFVLAALFGARHTHAYNLI